MFAHLNTSQAPVFASVTKSNNRTYTVCLHLPLPLLTLINEYIKVNKELHFLNRLRLVYLVRSMSALIERMKYRKKGIINIFFLHPSTACVISEWVLHTDVHPNFVPDTDRGIWGLRHT